MDDEAEAIKLAREPEAAVAKSGESDKTPEYSAHAIHLMRTAQINTLTLSQMADQKASILMGTTFLVFSLSVSRALTGEMPISLALLAIFSFLSSLSAVIAILPSVGGPRGKIARPNKLFFGHFTRLDEEEWTRDLLKELEQDETVLRTMMHDMYQNGQVLQKRKYRFLGYAYRLFIFGLTVTLLVFVLEWLQS